jgi:Astacin (Peptidase family M12A)
MHHISHTCVAAEEEKTIIVDGMEHIANNTCIVFVERTDEVAYINIKGDEHDCWAEAGYTGSKRNLNVPSYCIYSVGFYNTSLRLVLKIPLEKLNRFFFHRKKES